MMLIIQNGEKMKFYFKNTMRLLMLSCMVLMPMISFSTVLPFTEAECPKLSLPKTVLLVHATWCRHCQAFMPTYETVSNESKYSDWVFYQVAADDLWRICEKVIERSPVTYTNNMQTNLIGNRSQQALEAFLDGQ